MKEIILETKNLSKTFKIELKKSGFINKLKGLFHPKYNDFCAVSDLNITISKGEKVAFLGPNGAGKSTTLKMLTGILTPTAGNIEICNLDPLKDRKKILYKIGAVFGQISRLWYHLTPLDTFKLMGAMYDIKDEELEERVNKLVKEFDIDDILKKPVRKLSLGQRMKCEIITSLIHKPEIIFLDEPTIGLDIIAKEKLRETINNINKNESTTIILTSHDISDVEDICDRVIIINNGKKIFDDIIEKLKKDHIKTKILKIKSKEHEKIKKIENLILIKEENNYQIFEIKNDKNIIKEVFGNLMTNFDIEDISIEEPSMESIIKSFY